jgi:hypothetical protein
MQVSCRGLPWDCLFEFPVGGLIESKYRKYADDAYLMPDSAIDGIARFTHYATASSRIRTRPLSGCRIPAELMTNVNDGNQRRESSMRFIEEKRRAPLDMTSEPCDALE